MKFIIKKMIIIVSIIMAFSMIFNVSAFVIKPDEISVEDNDKNSLKFTYVLGSKDDIIFEPGFNIKNARIAVAQYDNNDKLIDTTPLIYGEDYYVGEKTIFIFQSYLNNAMPKGFQTKKLDMLIYYDSGYKRKALTITLTKGKNQEKISKPDDGMIEGVIPEPPKPPIVNDKIVFLSPSSQDKNMYWGGLGTEEYWCNKIADVVEKNLKAKGIIVYRNRIQDGPSEHIKLSNSKKPKIHVPIHTNAYNTKAQGTEIFVRSKKSPDYELAKNIYNPLSDATPSKDRGIKENNRYIEIKNGIGAKTPYIEAAFHDNEIDAKWIVNNYVLIGNIISTAIINELEL